MTAPEGEGRGSARNARRRGLRFRRATEDAWRTALPVRLGVRSICGRGRLIVAAALILALALVRPGAERYGDSIQNALPVAGLVCAAAGGGTADYLLRSLVLAAGIHGPKNALGDAPLNRRPNGSDEGFPSGHTAAATFGASAIVRTCVSHAPVFQAAVVVAAGFVGTSRVDAGKHTIWQVLAGAIWGLLADRAFRGLGRGSWSAVRRRLSRPPRIVRNVRVLRSPAE